MADNTQHAGTVADPIPQQILFTKTAEDGTKKVYTIAAGISVSGGGGATVDVKDATDTVKGINFLSDATDSELNAATGKTAATPLAVKQSLDTAKHYTDTKASETLAEAKQYTDQHAGGGGSMSYVVTPKIITPTHEATNVSTLLTIVGNEYLNVFQSEDPRAYRIFQVAPTEDFAAPILNEQANADTFQVQTQLTPNTKLYVRIRDVSSKGFQSEWSNVVAFTTAAGLVANTPVVTLHGYNDSPTDILSGLSITTDAYTASDNHKATSWSISTKDGTRAVVWQSLNDTTNKTSITVPDGTLSKATQYQLSVIFHGTQAYDSSPAVIDFTTSADFGTVNAPTLTVEGGPNTVYETPKLTAGAFSNTRDTDTHDMTDWQILDATGVSSVWSSLNDAVNKNEITVPADILQNSTAYKARVRYHGAKYGWSNYTTVDFTTVAQYNVVNTPTITVQGAPSDVKETPVLTGSPFGGINVTHKSTDWQILKASDNSEVWNSTGDTTNLTIIKVPKGILQVSTAYIFKVRYNANEGVSSSWAQATATCAAEFIRYNYIGVPGTSTFGVGLATKEQYELVNLTPADECENEKSFQYGMYKNIWSEAEGVILKCIPKFYIAMLQKNQGTENLSDSELDALLPYVEVTKEQMKEAQRRSPHNAMVVAPSEMFINESDANSHGFYLMRGFIDGGKEQPCFFISNTLAQATNVANSIRLHIGSLEQKNSYVSTTYGLYRASMDIGTGFGTAAFFNKPPISNSKGLFIASLANTKWQCCSIFAWAVISVLSLIQGQYATDTSQCAWYDSTLVHNYPKGINQNTRDVDDSTVTSDTVNDRQGSVFVTANYEKTTHNGSITGITNVNGWLWQFVIGSWGDGSKLLKRSASIYDITYDNVDNSSASFWETHNTGNISSQWGGTKSSFPDLTGPDKDLFGVYAFGGNTSNNSNEFGTDYHYRGGINGVAVGGYYGGGASAGVFYRDGLSWTSSDDYRGFRAMAYPRNS